MGSCASLAEYKCCDGPTCRKETCTPICAIGCLNCGKETWTRKDCQQGIKIRTIACLNCGHRKKRNVDPTYDPPIILPGQYIQESRQKSQNNELPVTPPHQNTPKNPQKSPTGYSSVISRRQKTPKTPKKSPTNYPPVTPLGQNIAKKQDESPTRGPPITPHMQKYVFNIRRKSEDIVLEDWANIIGICQLFKQPYSDDTFKPDVGSLAYDTNHMPKHYDTISNWLRPTEIKPDRQVQSSIWTVFRTPTPSHIVQGKVGDCWFLAALAAIAENPKVIENMMVTENYIAEGAYVLRICRNGKWTTVVIDDLIPCNDQNLPVFAKAVSLQLWVVLIEKALAKSFGCYEALGGGAIELGLSLLTGVPCIVVDLQPEEDSREGIDQDLIWLQLLTSKESGFLMSASCGVPDISEDVYGQNGLMSHHVYSILDVREVKGDGRFRLVCLRNPHGKCKWNGNWSDRSNMWNKVPIDVRRDMNPSGEDQGVFWISYEDIMHLFWSFSICKYREDWMETRISGHFLSKELTQIFQFTHIEVSVATEVDLTLFQNDQRCLSEPNRHLTDIWILVFSKAKNSQVLDRLVIMSKVEGHEFVGCDAFLDPGKYLVVCTSLYFWARDGLEFPTYVLSVHSSKPLVIQDQVASIVDYADVFIRLAILAGDKEEENEMIIYRLRKNQYALIIVVENGSLDDGLIVKFSCGNDTRTTRKASEITDYIPPKYRQLVTTMLVDDIGNPQHNISLCKTLHKESIQHHVPKLDPPTNNIHAPRPM